MPERALHRVSIKVAIYSLNGKSILATNIPSLGRYGLPGGHLGPGEEPLSALKRELIEELGIDDVYDFQLKASWWHQERKPGHEEKKLILGYTAKRDKLDLPVAPHPEDEFGEWLLVSNTSDENLSSYSKFVKEFQPV